MRKLRRDLTIGQIHDEMPEGYHLEIVGDSNMPESWFEPPKKTTVSKLRKDVNVGDVFLRGGHNCKRFTCSHISIDSDGDWRIMAQDNFVFYYLPTEFVTVEVEE